LVLKRIHSPGLQPIAVKLRNDNHVFIHSPGLQPWVKLDGEPFNPGRLRPSTDKDRFLGNKGINALPSLGWEFKLSQT